MSIEGKTGPIVCIIGVVDHNAGPNETPDEAFVLAYHASKAKVENTAFGSQNDHEFFADELDVNSHNAWDLFGRLCPRTPGIWLCIFQAVFTRNHLEEFDTDYELYDPAKPPQLLRDYAVWLRMAFNDARST